MINLISNIKNLAIYSAVLIIIGGGLGFYISVKTRPIPKDPELHQNTTPEIHGTTQNPTTPEQIDQAINADITVTREIKDGIYSGLATNGFKYTRWQDKIIIPIVRPQWLIQADFYAGVIDTKYFYMYGVSGSYFISDRFYFSAGGAGSSTGGMIKGSFGFAIY
jgi:hypothetical protein